MAEKKQHGRVPDVVGSLPLVGGVLKQADQQAQWMQDVLEQQARLVGQLPATLKTLNDSIERFNQTVQRLDRSVTQIERATNLLVGPLDRIASTLDVARLADIPEVLDVLRHEAVPALRAATDTQRQMALLQTTVERIVALIGELPGVGLMRRMTGTRSEET